MNREKISSKSLTSIIEEDKIEKRLQEVLGDKTPKFLSTMVSMSSLNGLQDCEPRSYLYAGLHTTLLGLELEPQLGQAYIIPYFTNGQLKAQLQIGYRGFYQLAIRTGTLQKLSVNMLTKSQFKGFDSIMELLQYDFSDLTNSEPYCYIGYLRLNSGFEKFVVWTIEDLTTHAETYSKGYNTQKKGEYTSRWRTNFDSMAKKTVIKNLIAKWGIVSSDMSLAYQVDQAIITGEGQYHYADNPSYIPNDNAAFLEARKQALGTIGANTDINEDDNIDLSKIL